MGGVCLPQLHPFGEEGIPTPALWWQQIHGIQHWTYDEKDTHAMQGQMGVAVIYRVNNQRLWEAGFVVLKRKGALNFHRKMLLACLSNSMGKEGRKPAIQVQVWTADGDRSIRKFALLYFYICLLLLLFKSWKYNLLKLY